MDDEDAPSSNDATRPWPSALRHANDREHDAELANVLSRTEIMVARFYKEGHLTLKLGQLFLDTVRHPLFDVKELRSETIVHLLRRLERPFTDTAVHAYNLWKEGDGNQRLELVVRDFLDVFRKLMRSLDWRDHFDPI